VVQAIAAAAELQVPASVQILKNQASGKESTSVNLVLKEKQIKASQLMYRT